VIFCAFTVFDPTALQPSCLYKAKWKQQSLTWNGLNDFMCTDTHEHWNIKTKLCQSIALAQSVSQFQTALLSKTLIWVPLNRNHWFLVFYQCVPLPLVNPLYIPISPLYSCPLTVPRFKRINLDWDNWAQAKVDWLCFMNLLSSSQSSQSTHPPPFTHNIPHPFLAVIITAQI